MSSEIYYDKAFISIGDNIFRSSATVPTTPMNSTGTGARSRSGTGLF